MSTLRDELLNGTLKTEIGIYVVKGNDGDIYNIINRKDITVKGILTSVAIRRYLLLNNLLLKVESGISDACKLMSRMLDVFVDFNLSNSDELTQFTSVLDELVMDKELGFIEKNKEDILLLGNIKISRAEQLGISVNITDIAQALRGN